MEDGATDNAAIALSGPADRGYVESLAPGPERDTVIASLVRYRKPESLRPGDPCPTVTLRRATDLDPVELAELCSGRPLLLVFGSFT